MSERLINAAAANRPPELGAATIVPHVALVREAVASLGWGTMTYACESCRFEWRVWLGLGVEGPPALRDVGLFVACPMFVGRCPAWPVRPDATDEDRARFAHLTQCDGKMSHVRFAQDEEFAPRLMPDDAPRFVLDTWHDSAQLVIPEPALIRARQFHSERESDRG